MIRKKDVNLSFGEQKTSQKGMFSVVLGILSFIAAIVLVIFSSMKQGNAGVVVGACGIVAIVAATIGIVFAVQGAKEPETDKMSVYIGFILNIIILIVWISLFTIGM